MKRFVFLIFIIFIFTSLSCSSDSQLEQVEEKNNIQKSEMNRIGPPPDGERRGPPQDGERRGPQPGGERRGREGRFSGGRRSIAHGSNRGGRIHTGGF